MKRKILCLLMCIVFVFYAFFITTIASDFATEKNHIESIAVDYITQYVNNAYLYQTNNLTVGTANQIFSTDNTSSQRNETLYHVNDEYVFASDLCDRMTSFKLAADYYRYIRTEQNIVRYNFTYVPTVIKSNVETNSAYVHIYTHISFQYQPNGKTAECGDNYIVHLLKIDGTWYIVDVEAEELIAYGLTDLNESYADKIAEFDQHLLQSASVASAVSSDAELSATTSSTTAYDRTYNINNAIAYAYTYTTQSYTASTGNNTSFLNGNFNYYSNGNCQNFVSQCIWAGFGGINESSYIINNSFPMNADWHTATPDVSHTPSWTSVNNFYNYVTSDDCELDGIVGSVNGNFYGIPLSYLPGASLQVRNDGATNYHHALFITDATGLAFTEIEICGNSPMRKAVMLADQNYGSEMRIIIPTSMQNGRTCTNGSHSFPTLHGKCSYCDFNRLTVTGTMIKPIPVGSTKTLTASASFKCFRMAICISYNGQETWTEYSITNELSKTYTFSNTGLYTITIVARDIDPSNADSVTATHVFTIRVY